MASQSSLVLTIFSTTGPLPTTTWTSKVDQILPALAHEFTISTPNITSRFLDSPSPSSSSPVHRVHQLLLPTQSPATQPQCTSFLRTLAPQTDSLSLSLVLTPLSPLHKPPASSPSHPSRLAVFDMDSTLIQQEVIDELARSLDLYASVSAITEAAMRGEAPYTDFTASLQARVALLKGVEPGIWKHLREEVITFTPGARELVRCLKAEGWYTAVLSGGFVDLAEWVKEELGLDEAHANVLETDEGGRLTGRIREGAKVVDGERKRELMERIKGEQDVGGDAVLAVGDGSNDLLMMGSAALGVAFCAKPKVQERAPAKVNGGSLVDVLYLLGWTEEEIREVMARGK
ncbi:phosphoserine phosphatase-like protein [Elsinoe australis]|uniref:phosphoserine phosphatase n=1 Tax=Elsinoe australis TaxID=40998 RepID=A0A4U7AXL8_9PEZI|nr:phosphoserine phosphatase-like protein [Elsinoe australis]